MPVPFVSGTFFRSHWGQVVILFVIIVLEEELLPAPLFCHESNLPLRSDLLARIGGLMLK